jgi:hypothetical protein
MGVIWLSRVSRVTWLEPMFRSQPLDAVASVIMQTGRCVYRTLVSPPLARYVLTIAITRSILRLKS